MWSNFLNMGMLLAGNVVDTANKVNDVLKTIVSPCLVALEGMAIIYIVILGVQYAKSESADKRSEAKKRIVNLAIGAVAILVMLTLCAAIKWDAVIPELFGYLDSATWGSATGGSSGTGGGTGGGGGNRIPGSNTTEELMMIRFMFHR